MSLRESIRKTVQYSSFFNFPLSSSEIHHWLISPKTYSLQSILKLTPKHRLNEHLRRQLLKTSLQKTFIAKRAVNVLKIIPTINLIAITGSVAIENAKPLDDIDLFIVTSPHTLWLTRLLTIPLLKLLFSTRSPNVSHQKKDSLCVNLWLDEFALSIPSDRRNLYTAHEVLQIKPVFDRGDVYSRFIYANSWTKKYLANAYSLTKKTVPVPSLRSSTKSGEAIYIIKILNHLSFSLQRFGKKTHPNELVTLHTAYFHPRNLSKDLDSYIMKDA